MKTKGRRYIGVEGVTGAIVVARVGEVDEEGEAVLSTGKGVAHLTTSCNRTGSIT